MSPRQVLPCLPEAPLQDPACSGEHSPAHSHAKRSKVRARALSGMVNSGIPDLAEDAPSNGNGVQLTSASFREAHLPRLPRPFTSRSTHDALDPNGQELTRGPVDGPGDSTTIQFSRSIPAGICELNGNWMSSPPTLIAGRDSIGAAGARLRGERGFLAMEEDQFESLGHPVAPASVHAGDGDRSPEIHVSSASPKMTARPEVTAKPHKTAEGSGALEGLDDLQLVSAAQSGEAAAFDILMLRHTSKLYGLVFHMSSSHEDTDDLLQEIWAKVYRSLPSFRGASRFSTWVHSIAVNMTLNFLKKRNRRSPVSINAAQEGSDATLADLPGVDAELEDALVCNQTPRTDANRGELQKLLSNALDELTPEHRAVVTMFDVQGMAHAEIAKVMGISEGTVRSRLFYAHRQLQSNLSDVASDFLQTPNKNAL